MMRERAAKIKHGHYINNRPSPEYYAWRSIKERCKNPNHHSYPKYGGSGILIHEEWVNDFKSFLDYIGPRPSLSHTVDRIDYKEGYVPGNIRWSDRSTQNRNRSDNKWITANDITMCLEDWAKKLGCSPTAIRLRVKRGWSWEKAVTVPPRKDLQNKNKQPNLRSALSSYRINDTSSRLTFTIIENKCVVYNDRETLGVVETCYQKDNLLNISIKLDKSIDLKKLKLIIDPDV
jgi:hypothetical protein